MSKQIQAHPPGGPATDDTSLAAGRAVDLLMGLAMALLALNHVREFFSDANYWPSDLVKTTAPMFFTHWATHISGPVFVFLAGTRACLALAGGMDRNLLSKYLLTRGLALILLEVTLVTFGWTWQFPGPVFLQLFWTLGVAMVAMAGLIYLPLSAVAWFGLIIIAGHGMLDPIKAEKLGDISNLWMLLHAGGKTHMGSVNLYISYPILPWMGIMAAGFAFGPLLQKGMAERKKLLLWLGLGLVVAFLLLRLLNGFGDKHPWETQDSTLFTVMSFLNTTRYPPSLSYLLMTLGLSILLIPLLMRLRGPIATFMAAFGQAPYFYLILNLYLVHVFAVLAALASGAALADLLGPFWEYKEEIGFGYALPGVYLVWLIVMVVSFPACRWYLRAKQRGGPKWLVWL